MVEAATSLGRLEGTEEAGVLVFRGVPFAAPPVGPLRWRPPQPVEPWTGTRPALAFGPIPPQQIGPGALARSGGRMDEDCLYLNLWTPAIDDARRPVFVFAHGGGGKTGTGSAPLLNGARLAACADMVVVTLNYRLGFLGTLNTPGRLGAAEGENTANLALQDIMAVLAFLRREAAAFGGDPANIVLAGQSTGAVASACLAASPAAWGLFDKLVLQSGGLERVIAAKDAAEVGEAFLHRLGDPDPQALRALPLEPIMEAQDALADKRGLIPPRAVFHPFVDGVIAPEHPVAAALRGHTKPAPLLAGGMAHEWRSFELDFPDELFEDAALAERAAKLFQGRTPPGLLQLYAAELGDEGIAGRRAVGTQLVGDMHFAAPTRLFARGQAQAGNPVFHYEIEWRSPKPGEEACHNICLALLFGSMEGSPKVAGVGEAVEAVSAQMQDAWGAFARVGNPSTSALGPWPAYAPPAWRTQCFGYEPRVAENHRAALLDPWAATYPWMP